MRITKQVVVLDAADVGTESTFWAGVLGGRASGGPDDDWHDVLVDGEQRLAVQLAPDHVPPRWPDGAHSQQVHLDLHVDDIAAAHAHVTGLGARVLKEAEDVSAAEGFQVYASPAGHPFCLCW